MKKYTTIIYILFISIFVAGIGLKDIKIQIGQGSNITQTDISPQNRIKHIENISGTLLISPINSDKSLTLLSTTNQLYIHIYDFTYDKIKQKLKQLLQQGTKIKIMMENRKYRQYHNTFKQIKKYYSKYPNFQLKSDQGIGTEYLHSKIIVTDNQFGIQTANFTNSSYNKNREHFIIATNQNIKKSLKYVFEQDWNSNKVKESNIHPNLVVCNINCRSIIEYMLQSASGSIIIQTQYISDPQIIKILGKKAENIHELEIILADTYENHKIQNFFGKKIVKILGKPYNHTKTILIDHKLLLVGSMNLSTNSLDNNREIGILIPDKDLIRTFYKQFLIDRKNSQ